MTDKTATVTITLSTNPTFAERYFVDMRDTTGGRNRQMRTWYRDAADARQLVADLRKAAAGGDVTLTVTDTTGEVEATAVVPMPHVEPNPVQHQAEGLTVGESCAAYETVTRRFRLRGPQRSKLDRSVHYSAILLAAHRGDWRTAERLLGRAGIIE